MTEPRDERRLFEHPTSVRPHPGGEGTQRFYDFPNGYGASVIRFKIFGNYGSYTSNEGEWELGVLHWGKLDYSTPITDDVLGHLSEDGVEAVLRQIEALPTMARDGLGGLD